MVLCVFKAGGSVANVLLYRTRLLEFMTFLEGNVSNNIADIFLENTQKNI